MVYNFQAIFFEFCHRLVPVKRFSSASLLKGFSGTEHISSGCIGSPVGLIPALYNTLKGKYTVYDLK